MKRWISRRLLRLLGWKIEGKKPLHHKYVLIAAPHTSNWDFPLMMMFAWSFDMNISWMGKQSLFYAPYGWVMRAMGGIPIMRHKTSSVVDSMVKAFDERKALILVVPAEGTRARTEFWKSGFYHIARKAGVPIVPSYLDFGQMRGGFGPALPLSGDVKRDMDLLRGFYAPMKGKFPELFGPIRLREEEPAQEQDKRAIG